MKNLILILLYCFVTLACGLVHVSNMLLDDIKTQSWEYGRVSLITSYWYEYYEPNKLLKWYKENIDEPLTINNCDRAATPIYINKYGIEINRNQKSGDDIYLLSSYLESQLSESRINEDLQWQNIYQITIK